MTLLREIQLAATDDQVSISTVLRKAKMLAARLQNRDFEDWVNRELNGFEDGVDLPPYRIMSSFLLEKLRWWAEKCHLRQPIAAIASMAESESDMQVHHPRRCARKHK